MIKIPRLLLMLSVWYFLLSALEKFINFDPVNIWLDIYSQETTQ